jgi:hypothetical protein
MPLERPIIFLRLTAMREKKQPSLKNIGTFGGF